MLAAVQLLLQYGTYTRYILVLPRWVTLQGAFPSTSEQVILEGCCDELLERTRWARGHGLSSYQQVRDSYLRTLTGLVSNAQKAYGSVSKTESAKASPGGDHSSFKLPIYRDLHLETQSSTYPGWWSCGKTAEQMDKLVRRV